MPNKLLKETKGRKVIKDVADSVVPLLNGLYLPRNRYQIEGESFGMRTTAEVGHQIVRGLRRRQDGNQKKVVGLVSRQAGRAADLRREADLRAIKRG